MRGLARKMLKERKILTFAFIGLIFVIRCSRLAGNVMFQPCATNNGYCWEEQRDLIQKKYLN